MSAALTPGAMYRCELCGAEITLLHPAPEGFTPVCCNRPMDLMELRAVLYRCPVCGAEAALIRTGAPDFIPRCCNVDMERIAA